MMSVKICKIFGSNDLWLYAFVVSFLLGIYSCQKLVTVDPPSTSINSGNVFNNDATAIAAITDVYVKISGTNLVGGGLGSLSLFPGLSADELALFNGATNYKSNFYYRNDLSATNLNLPDYWSSIYPIIYLVNTGIEELARSRSLTSSVKNSLIGEAKFLRAFCYFYLVNLYGDVPLALTSDFEINSSLPRTSKTIVYDQIIADLKDAQTLLSDQYLNATLLNVTIDRLRPTKWAAMALLARVCLYTDKWSDAENLASAVISHSSLYDTVPLDNVFLKNSREAIWQLQPVNAGWNTEDAKTFLLPSTGPDPNIYPFYLSSFLLSKFESGDKRKEEWVKSLTVGGNTYSYAQKYKSATLNNPVTEYKMVMRLAEQFLIRAEARTRLDNYMGARSDLNIVRKRARLGEINANDKASLLTAILGERQVELFTEWGDRWFDLKRTGNVDAVMSNVTPQKGGNWNSNWQWYPISQNELLNNHALIQNQGY